MEVLRPKLLGVKGIGQETADSILLYALEHPVFVVDAYTARILHRHALVPEDVSYTELQEVFADSLPHDVSLFNEYHALLVRVGKQWCKKSAPLCSGCPLKAYVP
jgi:endonuclease-3 related protein